MLIKSQVTEAMKLAMREKDKDRLGVLRLILSDFKQIEVDKRIELTDEDCLVILDKMLKQRKESIKQYVQANRQDLADKEQYEIGIIQEFMPQPLEDHEIQALINEAFELVGATSIKDMSKVMAHLKPKLQGRADLAAVGLQVKDRLS
jgi:uncharacterized protein YqeY